MSSWGYIHGTIVVAPMGRTQEEKRYILETVLRHLPQVYGSEGNANVYVIQKNGHNSSCTHDEFFQRTNNLTDKWYRTQDEYILVVDGDLRDTDAKTVYREFQNWLCRLAKRVFVHDIQIKINDCFDNFFLTNSDCYNEMFEEPSWVNGNSENWCEYLMWTSPRDRNGNLLSGKPHKVKWLGGFRYVRHV